MIRVIKTDLFRLFRTKAFYVYPIFVTVVMIVGLLFSKINSSSNVTVKIEYQSEMQIEEQESITAADENRDEDKGTVKVTFGWKQALESLYDSLMVFFLALTLMIFYTNESKNGFIKNSAGCVKDRMYMTFSKIVAGIVVLFIYIIEFAIISFIFSMLTAVLAGVKPEFVALTGNEAGNFWIFIGICLLAHIAIICILVFIYELTHSRAVGIVFGFLLAATLINQIIHGFVEVLQKNFGLLKEFDVGKYLMFENLLKAGDHGFDPSAYYPGTVTVMALIYTVLFGIMAAVVFKKKEVR